MTKCKEVFKDRLNDMIIRSEAILTSYNEARDSSVRARRELYLIELARSNYTCNINIQQLKLTYKLSHSRK